MLADAYTPPYIALNSVYPRPCHWDHTKDDPRSKSMRDSGPRLEHKFCVLGSQAAAELWERTISPLAVLFNFKTGQLVAGLPPVIYTAHAHAQHRLQRRSPSQQQYIKVRFVRA